MSDVITLDLNELADEWRMSLDLLETPAGDLDGSVGEDELDEAREVDEKCKQLCVDLGLSPANEPDTLRWAAHRQGITLIREDTFVDYIRDSYEGMLGEGAEMIAWAVDWSRVAAANRTDYYELTYDGHEWLRRA